MNKLECFAYFGITLKNIRWSWSGINKSGKNRKDILGDGKEGVAAFTLWTDQLRWDKENKCSLWSIFNAENHLWREAKGNIERIENLKYCLENLNGEFRPIFVEPKKPGVIDETREAKRHYLKNDKDFWYRITSFDEVTGECEAQSFIK
tara:strand:- start:44 stop:490 length:447 start_codon:yes stop_codon:yes gene_type:complete